jgi:hypothetical protein
MAMEFLAFNNELVPDFASDDQDDYLIAFDIIQGTQISCSQLELCQWIRSQPLDCLGRRGGLMLEARKEGRCQDPPFTRRQ